MQFVHRFFGESAALSQGDSTALRFAPDALRSPTYFVGKVARKLAFREAISALHHVVVSDLRYKARDKTAYLAWLAENDSRLLAQASARSAELRARAEPLNAELKNISARIGALQGPFFAARQKYFNWLYAHDRDAWIVLDPVVSVHPDEISFECFSLDESSYGRLACDHDVFESLGETACGTTNVDYSHALYEEFQRIRTYRETTLTIDPTGFETATDALAWREEKIDLPDSWTRGFLQVSCAMGLPAASFTLQPMDMANILGRLQARKEQSGPRSLRFHLKPGAPVRVTLEPWGEILEFPRSIYPGDAATEIRVWGRRRLALLARALPFAREIRVRLLGTGLPSFFTVDFGGLRFTLGLSGWTANDWTSAGRFDLLQPPHDVEADSAARVFASLSDHWIADEAMLARASGLDGPSVAAAMTRYAQAGRAIYDIDKKLWRRRELTAHPLPFEQLRFANPQEETADRFVRARLVTIGKMERNEKGRRVIAADVLDDGKTYHPAITLDADDRMVDARCDCAYFIQNKLMRGPCAHMLATRRFVAVEIDRRASLKGEAA
jgi:hypothetical protein